MKILFITPDFYPNSTGFANASFNLIRAIKENDNGKYDIYVFTDVPLGDNHELQGATVIRYSNPKKMNKCNRLTLEWKRYKFVKQIIDSEVIDVIFFETNTFPFLQNWVVREYGSKVFVRIHSTADTEVAIYGKTPTIGSKITKCLMKSFMVEVQNIVATSTFYLDFIRREYFDTNVYTAWDSKSYGILYNTSFDIEQKYTECGQNTFLTMGKMSENGIVQKGITDLIKAVYLLKTKGRLENDFKLIIIGDGEKYTDVVKRIEKYELTEQIQLIRSCPHSEVYERIQKSKAIILLSRYEGQSMFITESLALGKMLIITRNNGMADMVIDGKNGFLVDVGDPQSVAKSLEKVMYMSVDEIYKMGGVSKCLYEELFAPSVVYQQFDQLMMMRECL